MSLERLSSGRFVTAYVDGDDQKIVTIYPEAAGSAEQSLNVMWRLDLAAAEQLARELAVAIDAIKNRQGG